MVQWETRKKLFRKRPATDISGIEIRLLWIDGSTLGTGNRLTRSTQSLHIYIEIEMVPFWLGDPNKCVHMPCHIIVDGEAGRRSYASPCKVGHATDSLKWPAVTMSGSVRSWSGWELFKRPHCPPYIIPLNFLTTYSPYRHGSFFLFLQVALAVCCPKYSFHQLPLSSWLPAALVTCWSIISC